MSPKKKSPAKRPAQAPKTRSKRVTRLPAAQGMHPSAHPNDPALSALLARQEQTQVFLEDALSKLRSTHPNDPALSAGLGRLAGIEEKLDRLAVHVDGVVKRLKPPHPNDPALSVVLGRIEGIEQRLERLVAHLDKGPAKPLRTVADEPLAPVGALPAAADSDTAQFLSRTPLFAKLSALECGLLAQYLEPNSLAAGAILFKQDDYGDAMYVVKSGQLEIYKNDVFGAVRVAEVRPGGLVGEMALVENKPRSANVRAAEDCTLLQLSRGSYAKLKEAHPQVATKFQDELLLLLSGRLRQTTEKLIRKD